MSPEDQLRIVQEDSVDLITPEDFLIKLKNKSQLKVKLGVDPSRPDLHLGHAVVLRKLKQFQELGHIVYLIIGDFTARIGDPSGRSKTRPLLSENEVRENSKTYVEQAFRILQPDKTVVKFNSEWLSKLSFADIINLSSRYTVARMLERDDFSKRLKENQPISISEFLYPLAQAYDSVVIEADVELGGTDQLFNLLVGRKLQEEFDQSPQVVLTMPLIEGTDGYLKMSKSYDNYIAFNDSSKDIFGKVMSIPDHLIIKYMKYLTDIPKDKIKNMEDQIKSGEVNPRDIKMILAEEIVTILYNKDEAEKAKQNFVSIFQKREMPEDLPEIQIKSGETILDIVSKTKVYDSNSEIKRAIIQGAIRINDEKINDFKQIVDCDDGAILRVGKKSYFKIKKVK
ncbi:MULTISPECIES: tyrosine--tRNA ligase [Petrotoga]|uniref:Tyrosine--tRNA ligase n=2 Tax=Petrotoga sibirica TaxID=156202 RepID=A0A4R8EUX6_9BACT|nr:MULTISPECIES: tyrosine--tRNA ligase [Petrotoga]KUK81307.1 MAG: Tyrosine--tRNA ligase [Petrotoga mobilis]POZ89414.1 tyrosine--tRNA ligase [Petrotoga sibirica DSM 13575]POZ91856.1 tyrosine--tRNA ligase [Petrotoga sp. SL27]TDX16206.1 tyrosyl-tRNA synthetase [Petrotoga sibirica]